MEILSAQQEQAIELLLTYGSISRVCEELDIVPSTLWRWRQEPHFAQRYREVRRSISERTADLLQLAATRAVRRLVELMEDSDVPASIQFAAARSILDLDFKGQELRDIESSLEDIRQLLGTSPSAIRKGLHAV